MEYKFPEITNISQVKPITELYTEFIIAKRDGFDVVNYVVATEDTFPPVVTENDALRREMRGLIFDKDGYVLSRRYHKFFNLGEREETRPENIDFRQGHVILEKLDGSMVSPIFMPGANIRWATKMGITDTSMEAEVFVSKNPRYEAFARQMIREENTPIFEWCSRKNRIVLDYPSDRLVLTAIRHNKNGNYYAYGTMLYLAKVWGIDVVEAIDPKGKTVKEIVEEMKASEGTEGIVIRFQSGHMVKVKSDWYVNLHRCKAAISTERGVIGLWIEKMLDDILAQLSKEEQDSINSYVEDVYERFLNFSANLETSRYWIRHKEYTRKEYALGLREFEDGLNHSPFERQLIFKLWDKGNVSKDEILELVLKAAKVATKRPITWERFKLVFNQLPTLNLYPELSEEMEPESS